MGRAEHELAQLSSANEQLTAALAASEADGARALTAAQVRALRTSPHISPHTTMLFSSLLEPSQALFHMRHRWPCRRRRRRRALKWASCVDNLAS